MKRSAGEASGSNSDSRPPSAEHDEKRPTQDGRATAGEHGQADDEAIATAGEHGQADAVPKGAEGDSDNEDYVLGEDSDSEDEDHEQFNGDHDDRDGGYREEEYKSDPNAYNASFSFDPKRIIKCHGKEDYLKAGKVLTELLLENGAMMYVYRSRIYPEQEIRAAPLFKNL